jgi:hypothetical protein
LKPLSIISLILFLTACANTRPTVSPYLEKAEAAIARNDWEVAYRFLEDGLVSTSPETKTKAVAFAKLYPLILNAAVRTFSIESVLKTITSHGEGRGLEIESRRLEMYRTVATSDEYESAKLNVESAVAVAISKRGDLQRLADEKRKNDEAARAKLERGILERKLALVEAAQASKFSCQSHSECQKAFSLTQIFLSENSDMKIQLATETIIETYSPTESMKTGLRAVKIPRQADSAEIVLTATCRDEGQDSFKKICYDKLMSIYRAFPVFVRSTLRP